MTPPLSPATLERPHRQIWAIALPSILANSSAPLVGPVDTWAIGHLPEAVGLGSVIFSYLLWASGFLRMVATWLIAQVLTTFVSVGMMIRIFGIPRYWLPPGKAPPWLFAVSATWCRSTALKLLNDFGLTACSIVGVLLKNRRYSHRTDQFMV